MQGIPVIYQWLLKKLHPKAFVIGFVTVFLLLSVAGRIVANQNIYPQFQRFTKFTGPETLFYPTASQLRAIVKAQIDQSRASKITVIVGGSSVFNGVGQSVEDLWTYQLQKLLGNGYQVINLAVRSGFAQEGGAIVTQALLKEGYKNIIYVADTTPGFTGLPDGNSIHKYLYWDAFYKGMLPKYSARDKSIAKNFPDDAKAALEKREMQIRSWLDSGLFFNDLWTAIGYRWIFTTWNGLAASQNFNNPLQWLLPRILYPDQEVVPKTLEQRYPDSMWDASMKRVYSLCSATFKADGNSWLPIPEFWETFEQQNRVNYPEQLRKKTIMVVMPFSPYYVRQISEAEQNCRDLAVKASVQHLRKLGFAAMRVGKGFTPYDFSDLVHITASGGDKLARQLAPRIEKVALELGYPEP